RILGNAPLAVEAGKRAINRGLEMSLEDGLALEAELEGDLFLTSDLAEGTKAFLEKRTADFRRK
ncbi:MAG TPA: enoyl-CoA hydratase-related protein, partial [Syntrophales bacterium]|nr:enoyl-CoA hydratase-related protein [Syntrophales bacterium]